MRLVSSSPQALVPCHIAIIMDGNGRWAQRRNLPRVAGHQAGVQAARRVIEACVDLGVEVLTLYTFSTENWGRPTEEVNFLMSLLEGYLSGDDLQQLMGYNVRLRILGRREGLPPNVLQAAERAIQTTQRNSGLNLNLALNYGGRAEIVDAARAIAEAVQCGEFDLPLDEAAISQHLYTGELPSPSIIIRTGGEMRLSNFLIWQAAGAFFWVLDTCWPDFDREDLQAAIDAWQDSELCKGDCSA